MNTLYLRDVAFGERARPLVTAGLLDEADVVLVDAALQRFGPVPAEVMLAAALAVGVQRRGHVGVDLQRVRELAAPSADPQGDLWPRDLGAWQRTVLQSPLTGQPGASPDSVRDRPLVAQALPDGHCLLMTQRLWDVQARLATKLRAMASETAAHAPDVATLQPSLQALLLAGARPEHRLAKEQLAQALAVAARRRLTLILGGPGTGKTYSIRLLLAALLAERPDLRVVLAAPTGKAAVRMTEAMREAERAAPADDKVAQILANLPSATVHKLLGKRPDGSVRHHRDNPLPADLVIVDEASMVDLALMGQVVDAVAPGAQLVLLGDRDQLASVDVGTVLADIAQAAAEPQSPLRASLVRLAVNYRFADAPLVSAVAAAVQAGDPTSLAQAVQLLNGRRPIAEELQDVAPIRPIPLATFADRAAAMDALAAPYTAPGGYAALLAEHLRQGGRSALREPRVRRELLNALNQYRVLAAHRQGPLGVTGLEAALGERVRAALVAAWRERPEAAPGNADELPRENGLWLGQPVLVTENAYDVDLRNGDIGLVVCGEGQRLTVVFPVAAPADASGPEATGPGAREVPIARLPPHTGALAMTVHKSQGSQFQHVALVLAEGPAPLQTRDLVYTAITRAQTQLTWAGSEVALQAALNRTVTRASGLAPLLR
ncbi:MAG: exodeoxyribonuclease V subunit alpha [Deltaproteobacteria bacterium]|nr:exodeoxyribonuclease V subunit alpha [Deltaproteobacteria bacterium]